MAKSKNNAKKLSYISVPSQIINSISSSSLQSLLESPKKCARHSKFFTFVKWGRPRLFLFTLFLLAFFAMLKLGFNLDTPFPPSFPCATSVGLSKSLLGVASRKGGALDGADDTVSEPLIAGVQLHAQVPNGVEKGEEVEKSEFWEQPDGLGYKPCLAFSREYRSQSEGVVKNRRRYLMVVVSGGMNQQRNQIVDAVVIARILGAALVVPILQVNVIWEDER